MNKMIIDFEQYYCKSCCRLFNDIVHNLYYTYNNFIDNQARLTLDVDYKRELTKLNYHTQCPHCYSRDAVNINDILSGKLVIRSKKLAESNDKEMLKCLGEWLKFYGEITGYYIDRNVLYTDGKRIKQQIQRLMCRKSKRLNTISDK